MSIMQNKKLLFGILAIAVVGLLVGFIYFAFFIPAEYPQLKVGVELAKTQYQVGEEISIRPYIINMGKQSITVSGSTPLLFVKVYDADNRRVLLLPEAWPLVLVMHTLSPGMPFEREYIFTLDQPGRYKVVAWAEFSLERGYIYPLRAYAEPIWIEVVTYPQLKVGVELAKTQYQMGEEISVKLYLINMGKRPVTVFSTTPLLRANVYDAENRYVLPLPSWPTVPGGVLAEVTLSPGESIEGVHSFTLDQPGRYKIVPWVRIDVDTIWPYPPPRMYVDPIWIYADPIWIDVVTGSN